MRPPVKRHPAAAADEPVEPEVPGEPEPPVEPEGEGEEVGQTNFVYILYHRLPHPTTPVDHVLQTTTGAVVPVTNGAYTTWVGLGNSPGPRPSVAPVT